MNKNTVVSLQDREQISDPLTELVRAGARKLIEQAIDIELQELLSQYTGQQTDSGHAAVVRNGYLPERAIQTGIGPGHGEDSQGALAIRGPGHFPLCIGAAVYSQNPVTGSRHPVAVSQGGE